ncbi:Ent-kaurene oxidase [Leucoagaricus sp. SymC.cos]|nr:Ent-kaurene oxidase [Leucoagaricus sp. SymC.cos]
MMALFTTNSGEVAADLTFSSAIIRILLVFATVSGVVQYIKARSAIPTVGYSGVFTSYITALQWSTRGKDLIQEGYNKYPGRIFKVASISRWVVVVNGPKLVDDVRKAPDDILSFDLAIQETTQAEYTFGPGLDTHPHHISAISSHINRNLVCKYEELKDEVVELFNEYIPQSDDWVGVPAYSTFLRFICRSTNRYLVGVPLCRNTSYLSVVERLTMDVTNTAKIINIFPNFLKPVVGRSLRTVARKLEEGYRILAPVVQERLTQYKDDPNNLPLSAIPTVGYSGVFTSYITALQWSTRGKDLIQEGYNKYPGRIFKVASISRWVVVVNGPKLVDDVRKAPDDVLSFDLAIQETTQAEYTFGPGLDTHPHHISAISSHINRNLVCKYEELKDEVVELFNEYIPQSDDWVGVPAYSTFLRFICRSTNRYLVGVPLCRNTSYLSVVERLTMDVTNTAKIINIFPNFLKPVVGRSLRTVARKLEEGYRILAPVVQERLTQYKDDPNNLPNDLITWLLETATHDYHLAVRDLVMRIFVVNFTAIHTSTMAFTQGIYDLAVHPEYVKELREEAETVIAEHGWTKIALQKLRKIDSFLKESHRLNGGTSLVMSRKTLKEWTLSDGTVLPPNTFLGVASDAMCKSELLFEDAETFKPFRFAEMRDGDGELDSIKHHLVVLNNDHIIFGHGKRACPGRFFAANGMKTIFTYILLNYDVQLEGGSMERPPNVYFETSAVPNQEAKVMFRKRTA